MMKKTLSLFIVMSLSLTPLLAQWQVGVSGGYGVNSLKANNNFAYDIRNCDRAGFNVAAICGYEFTDWFTLKSELAYTQKNYQTHRSIPPLQTTYTEYTNGYTQIPLYGSFSFGGNSLRGFTNIGAYGGYWAYGWTSGVFSYEPFNWDIHYSHSYDFNAKADNRFEAGLLFGLGIMYNVNNHITVSTEGRMQYSLTDIQKNYMENISPKYYNTLLFNLGVTYKF